MPNGLVIDILITWLLVLNKLAIISLISTCLYKVIALIVF